MYLPYNCILCNSKLDISESLYHYSAEYYCNMCDNYNIYLTSFLVKETIVIEKYTIKNENFKGIYSTRIYNLDSNKYINIHKSKAKGLRIISIEELEKYLALI